MTDWRWSGCPDAVRVVDTDDGKRGAGPLHVSICGVPLEVLFLGTGTSAGVPMIGCDCPVCRSDDPRDRRSRPSVLVRYPVSGGASGIVGEGNGRVHQWLIDAGPDLRTQMIEHRVSRLDGVLITHTHADHVFGLDDMRRFNAVMDAPIDLYAEQSAHERLRAMFAHIFDPGSNVNQSFVAKLIPNRVKAGDAIDLHGARWTPLRLLHGRLPILGFRVDYPGGELGADAASPGSFAYCTDVSGIPPETWPLLERLDVLVIDALRYKHHPTHMTVDQALEVIDRLQPGRAYLTHIAHDISHAELEPKLPENVSIGFDGLVVSCGAGQPR